MADEQEKSSTINGLSEEAASEEGPETTQGDPLLALKESLATKTEEAKSLQDKYLRLVAEMENYKRVSQREQRESIRFGNEAILRDILPTLDNLDRAIKAAKGTAGSEALIQGVELTMKQLVESLSKHGVKAIPSVGQPFDPTHHQAVAQVESDSVSPGHVVEEFQKGYFLHDRVLRAAMVSVAAGSAS